MKKVIVVAVVALLLIGGVVYAYSESVRPDRLMNNVENPVAYFRAFGGYKVSAFLESNAGDFNDITVTSVDPPSGAPPINAGFFGLFESDGEAFVRVSVTGAGASVINFESERSKFHFTSIDVFSNAVYEGTFTSGTAAFPQHGETTWKFDLYWQESGSVNPKALTLIESTTMVVVV